MNEHPSPLCAKCGRSWRGFTVYDGATKTTKNLCRDTPNADGTWNYHPFVPPVGEPRLDGEVEAARAAVFALDATHYREHEGALVLSACARCQATINAFEAAVRRVADERLAVSESAREAEEREWAALWAWLHKRRSAESERRITAAIEARVRRVADEEARGHIERARDAHDQQWARAEAAEEALREVRDALRVVDAVAPAYYGPDIRTYVIPEWVPRPISLAVAIDGVRAALAPLPELTNEEDRE